MIELLERLREQGVASVRVACTHGLFATERSSGSQSAGGARDRLHQHVPAPNGAREAARALDPPALAEAIRRIHKGESVSALFGAS